VVVHVEVGVVVVVVVVVVAAVVFILTAGVPFPPTKIDPRAAADTITSAQGSRLEWFALMIQLVQDRLHT